MDMAAKVNPEAATVELPGDVFHLSWAERGQISDAGAVAFAVGAKKHGIPS